MTEKKKDEKKLIVAAGRTVMTKRGVAHAGAPVTADRLRGGSAEWYKLQKLKILIPPKSKKTLIDGEQVSIDHLGTKEFGEPDEPDEPGEPGESGEPDEPEQSKRGGAKRKNK